MSERERDCAYMSAHISAGVDEIGWKMKAAIALIIESEVITA